VNPFSWPVLVGTLLVGSPALYAAQVAGTLSPDVALVRLLLCAAGVWVVCSMVASLATDAVAANKAAAATAEAEMQRPAGVDS
jgi:hypothetical protein